MYNDPRLEERLYSAGTVSVDAPLVAIEIENEIKTEDFEFPSVPGWKYHEEHSLRYLGFEYVMEHPVKLPKLEEEVATVLEALDTALEEHELSHDDVTNSIRTSIHVHFDVSAYTYNQLFTWMLVYNTWETMLSKYCGYERQGNLFCLRQRDASWIRTTLLQGLKTQYPANIKSLPVFHSDFRYAGCNLNSVTKFGSLEFRMFRGTMDKSEIMNWVYILQALRVFALQFKHPAEYRKWYNDTPVSKQGPIVFGTVWPLVKKAYPVLWADLVREDFLTISPLLDFFARAEYKPVNKPISDKPPAISHEMLSTTEELLAELFDEGQLGSEEAGFHLHLYEEGETDV